jgi:Protein of unknown function (DUF3309)
MSVGTIVLILLVILLLGGFSGSGGGPFYGTGYYGGGGIGLVLVIVDRRLSQPRAFAELAWKISSERNYL